MNSIESIESVEFEKYFCKQTVFVTNPDATTVPGKCFPGTVVASGRIFKMNLIHASLEFSLNDFL